MILRALIVAAAILWPSSSLAQVDVQSELECLALNIYFEARGEPDLGKLAVAHVVLNRVADSRYPETICGVVQDGSGRRHRCQFSWWCDGKSDRPHDVRQWERSRALARAVFWGYSYDPTGGALWYHADYVRPVWRKKLDKAAKIGVHVFYIARKD